MLGDISRKVPSIYNNVLCEKELHYLLITTPTLPASPSSPVQDGGIRCRWLLS